MNNFLPFALPDIGEEEIAEMVETVRSGWITTGPKTARFEQSFADLLNNGVKAVALNSGTAGLHLALEALGIGNGDEVITTPYTFTATAEVVRYLGADVTFVDIDPNTLNIDPSRIQAAITNRTKAIIPVHFGGLACEMNAISQIAKKHGLKLVEDAAHALPTTYNGKLVGALESDATVFSFYVTKTLAVGEGGMLVTHHPEIAERCRVMCLHGINHNAFERYRSPRPDWYYEVIAPGFKYNMSDIVASLGIQQLKKVMTFHDQRAQMASRYDQAFSDLPIVLPPRSAEHDHHAWHLYVLRLTDDANVSRNLFIERMAEKGIGCSVHFIPLHIHPYWREKYNLVPDDFPNALKAYERAVSLPIYTKMSEEDQERVIEAVQEILG